MDAVQEVLHAAANPSRRFTSAAVGTGRSSIFTDIGLDQLRAAHAEVIYEKDWNTLHTPRNLVMVLSAASGELAEMFKWEGEVEPRLPSFPDAKKERVAMQLATLLLDVIALSDVCGLDLGHAAAIHLEEMRGHQGPRGGIGASAAAAGPRATSSTQAAVSATAAEDSPLAARTTAHTRPPFPQAPVAGSLAAAQVGLQHQQHQSGPPGMGRQPPASFVLGYPAMHTDSGAAAGVLAAAAAPLNQQALLSSGAAGSVSFPLAPTYSAPMAGGSQAPAGPGSSGPSPPHNMLPHLQYSWSAPVGDQQPAPQGLLRVAHHQAMHKRHSLTFYQQQPAAGTTHVLASHGSSDVKYPAMYQQARAQQAAGAQASNRSPPLAQPLLGQHLNGPQPLHAVPHEGQLGSHAHEEQQVCSRGAGYMYTAAQVPNPAGINGMGGRESAYPRQPQQAAPMAGHSYRREANGDTRVKFILPLPQHLQPFPCDHTHQQARNPGSPSDNSHQAQASECQGSHAEPLAAQQGGPPVQTGEQGCSSPSCANGTSGVADRTWPAPPAPMHSPWAQQQLQQQQLQLQQQQAHHGAAHTPPNSGSGEASGPRHRQPPAAARANASSAGDLLTQALQKPEHEGRHYPAIHAPLGGTTAGCQVRHPDQTGAGASAGGQHLNSGFAAGAAALEQQQQAPVTRWRTSDIHTPSNSPMHPLVVGPRRLTCGSEDLQPHQGEGGLGSGHGTPASGTPTHAAQLHQRARNPFDPSVAADPCAHLPAPPTALQDHWAAVDGSRYPPDSRAATPGQHGSPGRHSSPLRPSAAPAHVPHHPHPAAAADAHQGVSGSRRGGPGPSVFAPDRHAQPAAPPLSRNMAAAIAAARAAQREARVVAEAVAAAERVGCEEAAAAAEAEALVAAGAEAAAAAGGVGGSGLGAATASISNSDALRAAELVAAILQAGYDAAGPPPAAGGRTSTQPQEGGTFMGLLAAGPADAAAAAPTLDAPAPQAGAAAAAGTSRRGVAGPVQPPSMASQDLAAVAEAAAAHAARATQNAAELALGDARGGSGGGASDGLLGGRQQSLTPAVSGLTSLLEYHELIPPRHALEDGGPMDARMSAAVAAAAFAAAAGLEGDSGADYEAMHNAWQLSASLNEPLLGEDGAPGPGAAGATSRPAAVRASSSGRESWPTASTCAAAAAAVAAAAPPSRHKGQQQGGAAATGRPLYNSGRGGQMGHRPASPGNSVMTESYSELVRQYRESRAPGAGVGGASKAAAAVAGIGLAEGRQGTGGPGSHRQQGHASPARVQEYLNAGAGGSGMGPPPPQGPGNRMKRKRYTQQETEVMTELGQKYGWVMSDMPHEEIYQVLNRLQIPYQRLNSFILTRRPPQCRRGAMVSVITSRGLEGVPVGRGAARNTSHVYPLPGTGGSGVRGGYTADADANPSQRRRLNSMAPGPGGYTLPGLGASAGGHTGVHEGEEDEGEGEAHLAYRDGSRLLDTWCGWAP